MRYVEVTRQLDVPADEVWTLLTDTRRWAQWGPSVKSATVDGAEPVLYAGATGSVTTVGGLTLPFRITDWQEGRLWRWDVARLPATGHRVVDIDTGRCEVAFEVPWFATPYVVVCRAALGRIAAAVGADRAD